MKKLTPPIVLCVDDDVDLLRVMEILLKRRGFEVVTASSGSNALEIFQRVRCSAVVLDYLMPGLNGGEVAKRLRTMDRRLPIIVHTGYSEVDDPLLAYTDCTIPKGSFSFLVAKLNELIVVRPSQRSVTRKRRAA
jgi:CheY-like chemotaxis protein